MPKLVPASDLERRKQVRIRLRQDLSIAPQKYEGRTYWVVKDPVSLRYYRFKEQEHFLLQYMDGRRTLDDAQKEFEKRFRPDRLTLEDLEGFAQQLLTAGLAQNESPQAGKQLFDRRKKRRRSELMQALTNILYIKIPVFDPDKLLRWMLRYTRWIFTAWFGLLSLAFILSALMLVLTHFQVFRDKLPSYHEFFSFKTVVYLWVSLGVVKVIHEFGHGLSCKAFGGEVHEMGALFLCFSPCLYCNVSDAWTLPDKWKRIIISFAGIYVELMIAAVSTFVWWNSPGQPFINNLALSLMIVCSVSTVVFNANPLMRYDGYYILADWLEVPNLRDRSNRFLKNVILEHCLGVEVQPEPYMALVRKVLFILYAIVSYIYRWVVTFTILYFMYNWLPSKLRLISVMLAAFAAGSMVGWPIYRLGKNLHKRGRLPDMKPVRVTISSFVVAGVVLFIFLVPLPISRVRQTGAVDLDPEYFDMVPIETSGSMDYPQVHNGMFVVAKTPLVQFKNLELESALNSAQEERKQRKLKRGYLQTQLNDAKGEKERSELQVQIAEVERELRVLEADVESKEKELEKLKLRAPRDGKVMGVPTVDEVGKGWERGQTNHFCKVGDPSKLRVIVPVSPSEYRLLREDLDEAKKNKSDLEVTVRVQGLVQETWKGRIALLPEAAFREGDYLPPQLTNKYGGPLAVKPGSRQGAVVPQGQHYLVAVEVLNPDKYICPGTLAQVKIHCRWKTTAWWVWHKISDIFDLGLI